MKFILTRLVLFATALTLIVFDSHFANAQSNGSNLPATDNLGRKLPTHAEVGDLKPEKKVALFYWTWHERHHVRNRAFNIGKFVEGRPEIINDYDHPAWDPLVLPGQNTFHWEEPLLGFYNGLDPWVFRKHLELLGAAGVDALFFDASNGALTWRRGYEALGNAMAQAKADGVAVPQFAFILNFSAQETAAQALIQLYNDLYEPGLYSDSWFQWNNKPVIMGYPESLNLIEGRSPDEAAQRFTTSDPITGIAAFCPNFSNDFGHLTLSLYTWEGSLAASKATTPIATQTYLDFANNSRLELTFPSVPAGEYVWILSDPFETVGVWKYNQDTPNTVSFLNGTQVAGDYRSHIRTTSTGVFQPLTAGTSQTPQKINMGLTTELADEIRNFFTFRPMQPSYVQGPTRPDHWGWCQLHPQQGHISTGPGQFEMTPVSVAQNWSEQTNNLSAMNGPQIRGRSFTTTDRFSLLDDESYLHGHNFQEQWNRALEIDPELIFITGWNEWVMGRNLDWQGVENAFPDQFNNEYSRDIEPMKGGYGDNYYYQMIANIRRFKGMAPPKTSTPQTTINIDGGFTDWQDVEPEYSPSKGDALNRDSIGYKDPETGLALIYIDTTTRNDIVGTKVTSDSENLYFYLRSAENLEGLGQPQWIRLYLDIDTNTDTGWHGYDYMVDQFLANGQASLLVSDSSQNWTTQGAISFSISGNELELTIPKSLVNLSPTTQAQIEFKWFDATVAIDSADDFYLHGDAAPLGRFNFAYLEDLTFRITSSSPATGDWNVSTNGVIRFEFSAPISKGSGNITIRNGDNTIFEVLPISSPRITIDGNTATIDPITSFAVSNQYHVELEEGNFVDNEGSLSTALSDSDAISFTTSGSLALKYIPVSSDTDAGIDPLLNYTHLLDFGVGPAASINGVNFTTYRAQDSGSLDFSYTVDSGTTNSSAGNSVHGLVGGIADLVEDMIFNGNNSASENAQCVLTNLEAGQTYRARLFVRRWASTSLRNSTITFDPDGNGPISDSIGPINQDNAQSAGFADSNQTYSIDYCYTAVDGEDLIINLNQQTPNASWHVYGIANHRIPEPEDSYQIWQNSYSSIPSSQNPMDDFDNDGLTNIMEAWFGTDPTSPDLNPIQIHRGSSSIALIHPVNPTHPHNFQVRYQWSTDLENWHNNDAKFDITNTGHQIELNLTEPVLNSQRLFLRMVMVLEP